MDVVILKSHFDLTIYFTGHIMIVNKAKFSGYTVVLLPLMLYANLFAYLVC